MTFVYFEKTATKDLQFSLRVLFFKYTKEIISLEASGLSMNVSSDYYTFWAFQGSS